MNTDLENKLNAECNALHKENAMLKQIQANQRTENARLQEAIYSFVKNGGYTINDDSFGSLLDETDPEWNDGDAIDLFVKEAYK